MIPFPDIQSIANQIAERFNPYKIILFGSYAYGEPTGDSDVDLLILLDFENPVPMLRSIEQKRQIRQAVGHPFPMDLIIKPLEDAVRAYEEFYPFMRAAFDKGKILYERNRQEVASESRA